MASEFANSGASITRWTAEVFVPYDLLRPLQNVLQKSGTKWRANVYRVDYDQRLSTNWDCARLGRSFDELEGFGTLAFE